MKNYNKTKFNLLHFLILSSLIIFSGCSSSRISDFIFPRHINSFHNENEKITLSMIEVKNMRSQDNNSITQTIQSNKTGTKSIVGLAAGLAIGFISETLKKEANKYEAQFKTHISESGFYTIDKKTNTKTLYFSYRGFELVRTVENEEAFKLKCDFAPSKDGKAFLIKPSYFVTQKAKTKVLGGVSSKRFLYSILWSWLLKTGDEIDTNIRIVMKGIYTDEDQVTHRPILADFDFNVNSYSISDPKILTETELKGQGGWFSGVPITGDDGTGNFELEVIVTERDKSNAKKYIEKASEKIMESKPTIINYINK